uniref:Uncharacterized protein n=1 Tax=Prolemur simus TaxID=1328070 RepID=A0A8C8YQ56_PROSS
DRVPQAGREKAPPPSAPVPLRCPGSSSSLCLPYTSLLTAEESQGCWLQIRRESGCCLRRHLETSHRCRGQSQSDQSPGRSHCGERHGGDGLRNGLTEGLEGGQAGSPRTQ